MEENLEELDMEQEDIRHGKYMTFCIGSDVFGIELKYVNEIIQMQMIAPIPEVEHFIKGLINLRGKIIPVIDVADRFGKQACPVLPNSLPYLHLPFYTNFMLEYPICFISVQVSPTCPEVFPHQSAWHNKPYNPVQTLF